MKYNSQIDLTIVTDVLTEPVSLLEVKEHLNMFFSTSGSYSFGDDDDYLTALISMCRDELEQYCNLSFAPKTLKAIVRNELGCVELPYPPVTSVTTILDKNGDAVTDFILIGDRKKLVESPLSDYLVVTYNAGYAVNGLPKMLKRALLELITFRYNNRGDQQSGFIPQSVFEFIGSHVNKSWIA